jgi:hypothetical protein
MFEAARFFTIPINIQRYIQGTAIVLANQLISHTALGKKAWSLLELTDLETRSG